jgi:hypothetical protein
MNCSKDCFMAQQPPVGQGPLNIEASRSHSDTPHSVGLIWISYQPDAETPTSQHTTPPAGFELGILACDRPQTHPLDHAANGSSDDKLLKKDFGT